jgi:dipeptidase
MSCTTLLVGKNASYDGSTMIARNEDSGSGSYSPKKFIVVEPKDQPRHYKSVISHVEIDLPEDPMRYTAMPNAIPDEGNWSAAGVNSANVAMTATETLTTNERVLGADPLVVYEKAKDGNPEKAGGIGEEDLVTITLPYIHSAREGVERLGFLHEKYGTYEMNGIAFQDVDEVWWFETIGGHHWMARRVPDDQYVVMPNQLGIDAFDFEDAYGEQKEYMCSKGEYDLKKFVEENHLDLSMEGEDFNPRDAFGSHSDSDHSYNTPRAWIIERFFNPRTFDWDGEQAAFRPDDNDIPWTLRPERKITPEDVKYVLSLHYQGTKYDPYGKHGDASHRGEFRPIGINRNNFLSLTQIRPYMPDAVRAVEWIAFGSNVFNAFVPFYANIDAAPEYLANTSAKVTTDSFYWANRIIAALADAHYGECIAHIERYQEAVPSKAIAILHGYDQAVIEAGSEETGETLEQANSEIAVMVKEETEKLLDHVLYEASNHMKNAFARSDA